MRKPVWSSVDHYENFPVASLLMPAAIRPAVVSLYQFAREADDIADEGELTDGERLERLADLDRALVAIESPPAVSNPLQFSEPLSIERLRPYIARHALPVSELRKLIDAFAQDVHVTRYPDRAAVLDYCARSANPVGRLLLRLFRADGGECTMLSDRICSALQLINFLQDVDVDWMKGRVYLPQDALTRAGSSDDDIAQASRDRTLSAGLKKAIATEASFAAELLAAGAPLVSRVPWRLALELRVIIAGGQRILDRIARCGQDVFNHRPTLGWRDSLALLALTMRPVR